MKPDSSGNEIEYFFISEITKEVLDKDDLAEFDLDAKNPDVYG
jgi:hypothetical protein